MTLLETATLPRIHDDLTASNRPSKRRKTVTVGQEGSDTTLVRRHPLGVRPSGNALTSSINAKDNAGLFARLPDELILSFLESLQVPHLLRLGATCRALHAFTRSEELWSALFVESQPSSFQWRGTWRSTYLSQDRSQEPRVDCSKLFSDALHRPYFCAHVPLNHYSEGIPHENQIPRLSDITAAEFAETWLDRPFILTSPVKTWSIYGKWTTDYLLSKSSKIPFRAESVDWPLSTYVNYMRDNHDESPLYLFDRSFAEKMNLSAADYSPPACFSQDFFSLLGAKRPDHRWLIIGPARSGSTFHKDPNATSAWNAVIRGSKYWIMFPPSILPPGVYVSEDQSEVTSPLSIAEWLLGFHAEARATMGCKEGICGEGEVVYVPGGWYHMVLNLEESIAVTQNFVPRGRVESVLSFLRDQKQSVSGFDEDVLDAYELFVGRLREKEPEVLDGALKELDRLASGKAAKGKWEELKEEEEGGFSFGFGGGDDVED